MYKLFLAIGTLPAILEYESDLFSTLREMRVCVENDLLNRAKMLAHGMEWKQRNYSVRLWDGSLLGVAVVRDSGEPIDPSGLLPKFS